jgi:hypothetical protein
MAAAAHVIALGLKAALNEDVRAWFAQFNWLPPIPLIAGKTDTVHFPASLENLLHLLAQSAFGNFILIIHGYEDGSGLAIPLMHTHTSRTGAMTDHFHLQRLMDLDDPQKNLPAAERAKLGLSDAAIGQLLALRRKVREKRIDCIEFRACNLGRNKASLDRFREFFGARRLGAPDLHSFFGHGPLRIGQDLPRKHNHGSDQAWEIYKFPNALAPPDLCCCFHVNEKVKPDDGHVYADSRTVLDAWVQNYLMPAGRSGGNDMPIHGLWVTGRQMFLEAGDVDTALGGWGGPVPRRVIFPTSEIYRSHIIYSR